VSGLAIGTDGDVWFTRGFKQSAAVGRVTATGVVTQTLLARGSLPSSVAVGADGAAWFTERNANKIGRITTGGDLQLFPLGRGTHPLEIVADPDGALFSEAGRALPGKKFADRIGRITTAGEVSEFPITFGHGTDALAADPRGVIWFTIDRGEISSISTTTGAVGARGCFVSYCRAAIESIAVASDGALWFAAAHEPCTGCGGGSVLIHNAEGTQVGEIPAGALEPAPAAEPLRLPTSS
jgi:virginiamycin B lyase